MGIALTDRNQSELIDIGMRIKRAVMASCEIRHPDGNADLNFLYGVIFVKVTPETDTHSRNVCVFAEGEVDRSPTGTGVSGRLAIHHAKGEIHTGETIIIESLIGTQFSGRVIETTIINGVPGVIPEVSGTAYITGHHEFLIDPDDPLANGFILR